LPDHWPSNEEPDAECPFKLATSPARNFLNSTFTETPSSRAREKRPTLLMNALDADELGVVSGDVVTLGNSRGRTRLHVEVSDAVGKGLLVSEGVWPNECFLDGRGINTLTSDEPVAPFGGAALHDCKVWAIKASRESGAP